MYIRNVGTMDNGKQKLNFKGSFKVIGRFLRHRSRIQSNGTELIRQVISQLTGRSSDHGPIILQIIWPRALYSESTCWIYDLQEKILFSLLGDVSKMLLFLPVFSRSVLPDLSSSHSPELGRDSQVLGASSNYHQNDRHYAYNFASWSLLKYVFIMWHCKGIFLSGLGGEKSTPCIPFHEIWCFSHSSNWHHNYSIKLYRDSEISCVVSL
jgi:hypothetical protein